jgi:hypothetical protein
LESVFSQETFLTRKKWKYSFFYNGESIHTTVNKLLKGNVKRLKLIPHYDNKQILGIMMINLVDNPYSTIMYSKDNEQIYEICDYLIDKWKYL